MSSRKTQKKRASVMLWFQSDLHHSDFENQKTQRVRTK